MNYHKPADIDTSALFITERRMLELRDYCLEHELAGITGTGEWYAMIGCPRTSISKLLQGKIGFTKHQMLRAAELFNVNINWLYGLELSMFRIPPAPPAPAVAINTPKRKAAKPAVTGIRAGATL